METKCFIEFSHQFLRDFSNRESQLVDGNGPDLFRLSLGVVFQTCQSRRKQHLKWVDARDVRGHRHDGDHPLAISLGGNVCSVVAHDDGWSSLVGLAAPRGIKVDNVDLASAH